MRIALVHDWLTGLRGGERVLDELVGLYPGADLFTLIHVPGRTTTRIEAQRIEASPLSRLPGVGHYYRLLLPLFPWAIRRFDLSDYDLVISCSHAVAKGVRTGPRTVHLCYCLTPMRYIWDQSDAYLGHGLRRRLAQPWVERLRAFDRATSDARSVTGFVAVSSAVKDRIARHYDRDAAIVHPPVAIDVPPDTQQQDPTLAGDYLLVGGFVPYKREALAIGAFRDLDRTLWIAGDGPMRRRLARRAPPNVRFLGRVSDAHLRALYRDCRALVYPQEEDFGIVAVEAQAAGLPVIAFGAGGALDTVRVNGPLATGLHFAPQSPAALTRAIRDFETREGEFDASVICAWAQQFGIERFREAFQHEVEKLLELESRPSPPS